jgi:hypothetical protein
MFGLSAKNLQPASENEKDYSLPLVRVPFAARIFAQITIKRVSKLVPKLMQFLS